MNDAVRRSRGNAQPTDTGMIMLIRHAEKPLHPSDSPHGVDPDGREDPHSLTVTGWIRAGALVELFAPSRGDSLAELASPDIVMLDVAPPTGGQGSPRRSSRSRAGRSPASRSF